jgi:two-component system, OmpR family, sensor histidine kinase VicK
MRSNEYLLQAAKEIGRISDDGVLVYDLSNDAVEYANKQVGKLLQVPSTEIVGANYRMLAKHIKDDKDFLAAHLERLKSYRKISNLELRVDADKSKLLSCDAYYIKKKERVIVMVKNVTDQKQHTHYLVDYGARKDTILDMVAHNLSGPLNLTTNLLDAVDKLGLSKQNRTVDKYTLMIRENTQHCIDVINSLIKEEHFTSEKISVETNRFDVISKIQIIVERFRQFYDKKKINIIARKKELIVTSDDVKLFQIINNLISNAVKFTREDGKIDIIITDSKDRFAISVVDNGIGIPEYLHPHLFKKNTPAGRSGLNGEKSIGMGLHIVKKLVELLKGELNFKSEEDNGATFTIELPKVVS